MQDTKVATGHKDDPADVARDALEALVAGKDHVVAGSWRNKAQAAASRVMPAPAAAKTQRPMTEPAPRTRMRADEANGRALSDCHRLRRTPGSWMSPLVWSA